MKAEHPRFPAGADSLIKKHLTPKVYAALSGKKTAAGFTLDAAIRSGLENPDSSIGIYIGDKDAYPLFEKVLAPIIREYHKLEADPFHTRVHRDDFSPVSLPAPDPEGSFILSTRIRVARNLNSLPFCPHMTAQERVVLEKKTRDALLQLPKDLAGRYISFTDLGPENYDALVAQKLAFAKGDRFQEAAGLNRDFPTARGVFLSRDKGFRVWVNEEDHLRIMALSTNADLSAVFNRLAKGLAHLSACLKFAFDPGLGFLSSCPTNIGTAMRAGVHIRLPKLDRQRDRLKEIVARHHLQIRGTGGEKTAVDEAVFDISNALRLGVSANQTVRDLHAGLLEIITLEKNL
ncbi:MAG TPA: arginine kinase [Desulfobacteraceae bacterium]|nr:arginine kinase [Desulfobacteraceae bacterium]